MKLTLTLLLLLEFLMGCNTQETAPKLTENYFSIDGINYPITSAALLDVENLVSNSTTPFQHSLVFGTEKIMMAKGADNYFNLSGNGPLLGIVCFTKSPNLEEGDYFVALRRPNLAREIGLGFFTLNWQSPQREVNYWEATGTVLQAGKMSIRQKQTSWALSGTLVGENNSEVIINYRGTFEDFIFKYHPQSKERELK